MKQLIRFGLTLLVVVLMSFGIIHSQEGGDGEACSMIVEQAFEAIRNHCESVGRNEACYGNGIVEVEPRAPLTELVFDSVGDLAKVVNIASLHSFPMTDEFWGVVLMRLQVTIADALPGQNVTFLVFGEVAVEDRSETSPPMRVIYLETGIGDSGCAVAPESGVLVQTPDGVAEIEITINGVDVVLGSTAYIQAQPEGTLDVYLLEGQAAITAFDETVIIPSGAFARVPLDELGMASEGPTAAQPYELEKVVPLPIDLLQREIEIAEPLIEITEVATPCVISAGRTVNLREGPSTGFRIVGQLTADGSRSAEGQAEGYDGLLWWYLGDDQWVLNDIVSTSASCEDMPFVTNLPTLPLPPPPTLTSTPKPSGLSVPSSNGTSITVQLGYPSECTPSQIAAGTTVTIEFGMGYKNDFERQSALDSHGLLINGVSVPLVNRGQHGPVGDLLGGFIFTYNWGIPASGTYALVALDRHETRPCTVEIIAGSD